MYFTFTWLCEWCWKTLFQYWNSILEKCVWKTVASDFFSPLSDVSALSFSPRSFFFSLPLLSYFFTKLFRSAFPGLKFLTLASHQFFLSLLFFPSTPPLRMHPCVCTQLIPSPVLWADKDRLSQELLFTSTNPNPPTHKHISLHTHSVPLVLQCGFGLFAHNKAEQ